MEDPVLRALHFAPYITLQGRKRGREDEKGDARPAGNSKHDQRCKRKSGSNGGRNNNRGGKGKGKGGQVGNK